MVALNSDEWKQCIALLLEPDVSEIETNGPDLFFIKKAGKRIHLKIDTGTGERYLEGIEKDLIPLVKQTTPYERNSYLFEGPLDFTTQGERIRGRCHIVLPPAADHPQVTIAKKSTSLATLDSIASRGSMSEEMLAFLKTAIEANLTMVFSGGTGAGKSLTLDTKIPTPHGWTTMGSLQVGDKIFNSAGEVSSVTAKFPQPKRQVYSVQFSDGSVAYCDLEHNWFVSTIKNDTHSSPNHSYDVKTTGEMLEAMSKDSNIAFVLPQLTQPLVYKRNVDLSLNLKIDELPGNPYDIGLRMGAEANHTFDKWSDESIELCEGGQGDVSNIDACPETLSPEIEFSEPRARLQWVMGVLSGVKANYDEDSITASIDDPILYSAFVRVLRSCGILVHTNENSVVIPEGLAPSTRGVRCVQRITAVPDRFEEMACITVDSPDRTYLCTEDYITTHNTTMLEACTKLLPDSQRIGVAEDTPELYLVQPNVTYLHSVPWQPGMDPNNVATLSWVVAQFQRMRTDRLIVGETRGQEFASFLTAANSGMDGSMTTLHANDSVSCLKKMSTFAMKGSPNQPTRSINTDIASGINLIVQLKILPDGRHKMSEITEVTQTVGASEAAEITTSRLFYYDDERDMFVRHNNMSDQLRLLFKQRGVDDSHLLNINPGAVMPPMGVMTSSNSGRPAQARTPGSRGLPVPGFS